MDLPSGEIVRVDLCLFGRVGGGCGAGLGGGGGDGGLKGDVDEEVVDCGDGRVGGGGGVCSRYKPKGGREKRSIRLMCAR
jgi:hypothetical protein